MKKHITLSMYIGLVALAGLSSGALITNLIEKTSQIAIIPVQQVATAVSAAPETDPDTTTPTNSSSASSCPKPKVTYADETYAYVGQDTPLKDKKYIPSDLVELPKSISKYTGLCVTRDTATALERMISDAKADGKKITVSSGFRSYDIQQILLDNNLKETGSATSDSVAKPGYSEHQLGVTVDLTSPSISNSSADGTFASTPESAWLETNAYKYGFVQSYPEGKEDVTGYTHEAWHYRYVGIANALEIKTKGITITEFLKQF